MFVKKNVVLSGKGRELLSALGVNFECHASSVFLALKPPLSIIDALSIMINNRCILRSKGF